MKPSKSTTILLNIVLILVIALLIKSLIIIPKEIYAQKTPQYSAIKGLNYMDGDKLTEACNYYAKKGWKLFCISDYMAVFER